MYSLLYHIWKAAGAASRKVLKFDRPLAGGFLGLTGLRPEGCGIAFSDEFYMPLPPAAAELPMAAKTVKPGFARPMPKARLYGFPRPQDGLPVFLGLKPGCLVFTSSLVH